jgi:hypothetical protein
MEPFTKHTDQPYEHRDITHTEEQLLAMALANLGEYIHDNSPQYVLIEDDPRNEDDYDDAIDVSPSDAGVAQSEEGK